jgi:hypothetical protein
MAIDVTCASCKTRFQVSDKFAGKQGPCPKCKAIIKVPAKSEQVVIHEPEPTVGGKKSVTGQPDFRPIAWKETRISTLQIVGIAASVVGVLLITLVLRIAFAGNPPLIVLIVGSIVLAPPLAFAGYAFLRDHEFEPHRGKELVLRLIAPSVVYPGLWGLYWGAFAYLGGVNITPNWQLMCVVVPVVVAIGAFAAQASLDLELGAGALHYSVYLLTTLVLRAVLVGHEKLLWVPAAKSAAQAAAEWIGHGSHLVLG